MFWPQKYIEDKKPAELKKYNVESVDKIEENVNVVNPEEPDFGEIIREVGKTEEQAAEANSATIVCVNEPFNEETAQDIYKLVRRS
jgi:hypothetical protein